MTSTFYNYNISPVKRFYSEIIYSVSTPYTALFKDYEASDYIMRAVVDVNIKFHIDAFDTVLSIKNAFREITNMSAQYTDLPWIGLNKESEYMNLYGLTGITFQVCTYNYYDAEVLQQDTDNQMQYLINGKDEEQDWDPLFVEKILDIPNNVVSI